MKSGLTSSVVMGGIALLFAAGVALGGSQQVFYSDFNASVPGNLSGITTVHSVDALSGIGNSGNTFSGNLLYNTTGGQPTTGTAGLSTILTITGLPAHDSVDINFLLAAANTWDGWADRFHVKVNGVSVFSETLDLGSAANQTYVPPAQGLLTPRLSFGHFPDAGFNNDFGDAGYDMGVDPRFNNIAHTSSTLVIEFFADGVNWEGGTNEAWGIDNLQVIVNNAAAAAPTPEPTSGALVLCCGAVLLLRRRR
jgi:hypothetical protein